MTIPLPLQQLVSRSQAIGAHTDWVVFGGGNTSSKGEITDYLGRLREVLWVKGSGADMKDAVAVDYPGLYLQELIALMDFDSMDDEKMVDFVTRALVDPTSRRPSIETLLHAFLPAKHIDHVHADAICALTNHSAGEKAVREALGEGVAYVDWKRPGFDLSKIVSQLKDAEAVVLAHHGLIVWDNDSDECFKKNGLYIKKAESYLSSLSKRPESNFHHDEIPESQLEDILLTLRGSLGKKQLLGIDSRLKEIASRSDVQAIVDGGTSSADHMLRIRPKSAVINPEDIPSSIEKYRNEYSTYFESNKHLLPEGYSSHGNDPRVLLVPGVGAITTGSSSKETSMLGEIAFHTHSVAAQAIDAFGNVEPLPDSEIFGFDYWPMELFKLKNKPAPLRHSGRIYIITGAGSGIGRGIALGLASEGAQLVLADLDQAGLNEVSDEIVRRKGLEPLLVVGDQSDEKVVGQTVRSAVLAFGGLDGVVPNAGIGVSDNLEDLTVEKWRAGLEINLTGAFLLTKAAMKVMRKQGLGGSIAYVASKNAFAPGAGFGGYSVSKAGMLQLMRIAALEGGSAGIRANAVNPDAIFDHSKLWEGGVREQRAAAHGIAPEKLEDFYADRNLLKSRVRSSDVAASISFLLSDESSRTTGAVLAVDGGVSAAFPR